jgi:general secretion pathway protein J
MMRRTGFTLIEVMVTLTVLGFVLVIVFGAFRLGLSAWERGESSKEEYQRVRIASQVISQQLKSIVPYKIKNKGAGGDYLAFEGKAQSLKFVSAFPIKAKQNEGLVFASYEFEEGGKEGGRLVLSEQRVLNKDFMEEGFKEEAAIPLLEGISQVRFEYFREGDPQKDQTEEWVEEWIGKDEKELPKSLKATITFKGKDGKESTLTLMPSISANQFEERRVTPRGIRPRPLPGGSS